MPTSSHDATCTFKHTFGLDQRSSTPQIVKLVMALLHYLQATVSLPTAKEMALCKDRYKQNSRESVKLTQRLLLKRELHWKIRF